MAPFSSKDQARYLFANHPEIAKKWEAEYHQKLSSLPAKLAKKKKKKRKDS